MIASRLLIPVVIVAQITACTRVTEIKRNRDFDERLETSEPEPTGKIDYPGECKMNDQFEVTCALKMRHEYQKTNYRVFNRSVVTENSPEGMRWEIFYLISAAVAAGLGGYYIYQSQTLDDPSIYELEEDPVYMN